MLQNSVKKDHESEGLLPTKDSVELAEDGQEMTDRSAIESSTAYTDNTGGTETSVSRAHTRDGDDAALTGGGQNVEYRVYKIRWFGLTQLILLNIIVSWDVRTTPNPPLKSQS